MWNFCERLSALHHKINTILTTIVIPNFTDCAFSNMAVGIKCKVAQENQDQERFVRERALKPMNVEI